MVSVVDYFLPRNFCNNLAPIWESTSLTRSLGSFIVQMHQVVIAFFFHLFSVPLTRSQISQVHIVQNMKIHSGTKKLLYLLHFHLPYARHYNPRFVYFLPHFLVQERLILQTILVHKQGKLGLKSAVYKQERFQIKSGL